MTRAVRNSRGQWCYPVFERYADGEPVHHKRTLVPLGIPGKLKQEQADMACDRFERRLHGESE